MKQVLVVDDSSSNLQMVKNVLQKEFAVTLVNNGERALQFLEKKKPDIIIMDIMMPGLDGIETVMKIKEYPQYANIPVIMLTAMADYDTQQECDELGASCLLAKPFLPSKMLETVKQVLADFEEKAKQNTEKD